MCPKAFYYVQVHVTIIVRLTPNLSLLCINIRLQTPRVTAQRPDYSTLSLIPPS